MESHYRYGPLNFDDVEYWKPADYQPEAVGVRAEPYSALAHIGAVLLLSVVSAILIWASSVAYDAFVQASYLIH